MRFREALRLALIHHKSLATGIERTSKNARFRRIRAADVGSTLIAMTLNLIVGSGGILRHAPRWIQSMLMMVDARALGLYHTVGRQHFYDAALGGASTINEQAATDVFVRDCMIYLGTCIAPIGQGRKATSVPTTRSCFPMVDL